MKKRIFRIIILLLILASVFIHKDAFKLLSNSSTVRAVGDLRVDWGIPHEGDPLFKITNMSPGQSEEKEVHIINDASTIRPVGVRGIKTVEVGNLSEKLKIFISKEGTNLYVETLANFFEKSSGPDGIKLFNANPGTDNKLKFKVLFDPSAGNEFQNTKIVFDLHIGISVIIPDECKKIKFVGDPIFGTEGNDNLRGTNGNDIIYGFEGDDTIESSNGNDCVIGGIGNDKIDNSNGDDILYGDEGDDTLMGSNGNDQIFGGDGRDRINASNGDDVIYAGEGNDTVYGGNGDDIIYGGNGDDVIYGNNNDDKIIGGGGDDNISGGNGNDVIDGEMGTDLVNGGLGFDRCEAERKKGCEN